jgi:hypothetical protein
MRKKCLLRNEIVETCTEVIIRFYILFLKSLNVGFIGASCYGTVEINCWFLPSSRSDRNMTWSDRADLLTDTLEPNRHFPAFVWSCTTCREAQRSFPSTSHVSLHKNNKIDLPTLLRLLHAQLWCTCCDDLALVVLVLIKNYQTSTVEEVKTRMDLWYQKEY